MVIDYTSLYQAIRAILKDRKTYEDADPDLATILDCFADVIRNATPSDVLEQTLVFFAYEAGCPVEDMDPAWQVLHRAAEDLEPSMQTRGFYDVEPK